MPKLGRQYMHDFFQGRDPAKVARDQKAFDALVKWFVLPMLVITVLAALAGHFFP